MGGFSIRGKGLGVYIKGDIDTDVDTDTDLEYAWLSKLWSLFGSLEKYGT